MTAHSISACTLWRKLARTCSPRYSVYRALRTLRGGGMIIDQLRYLSVSTTRISNMVFRRVGRPEIVSGSGTGSKGDLFGSPTAQLSNLPSPIFMEYESRDRNIRLIGPNFRTQLRQSFRRVPSTSLHKRPRALPHVVAPHLEVFGPSFSPAPETFAVAYGTWVPYLLQITAKPLIPLPPKTLEFLNYDVPGDFTEKLT